MKAPRIVLGLVVVVGLTAPLVSAQIRVDGYMRRDGTYVQPHQRTVPDGNPTNNYGYPGNYNPNTGQITGGNPSTYQQRYSQPPAYYFGQPRK